ncbi:tandem-95 repeat protein, partial [Singulisphaera rosea]
MRIAHGSRSPRRRCRQAASRLRFGSSTLELLEARLAPAGDFGFAFSLGTPYSSQQVTAVAADGAGNVYVTGDFAGTEDFDPGPGTFNLTSVGFTESPDMYVAKYNATGKLVWAGQMGGAGRSTVPGAFGMNNVDDIAVDTQGNVYLVGDFWGTVDLDPSPSHAVSFTSHGFGGVDDHVGTFVTKLDTAGNLIWAKAMDGTGRAIAVDGQGAIYMTGSFDTTANLNPAVTPPDNHTTVGDQPNTFVEKLDSNGNDLWSRAYGSTSYSTGVAIAVDNSGNVYSSGIYQGSIKFDPTSSRSLTSLSTTTGFNSYLLKLDTNGQYQWAGSVGGTGNTEATGIATDSSGAVYTVGSFQGSGDFDPGAGTTTLVSAGEYDAYFEKLDTNGRLVWANRYGSTSYDGANGVSVNGSGVYVTGDYGGSVDFNPGTGITTLTSAGGADVFVNRYETSTGALSWARSLGGVGDETGFGIATDHLGNVFTVGRVDGPAEDFDPSPTATYNLATSSDPQNPDVFISKLTQPTSVLTAANDTYAVSKNIALAVSMPGVLANDTIVGGGSLSAALVSRPVHGSLTLNANGSFTYTPNSGFIGTDTFLYDASDGTSVSNTATVTLKVSGADDKPVAVKDAYTANENSSLTVSAPGVLANDSDPNGDKITATLVAGPANGTVVLNADGSFTYTPKANFWGADSFTYSANDGTLNSTAATATITVNHVNQPPTAVDDRYAVAKGVALTIPAATGVLANDTDIDKDTLSVVIGRGQSRGNLTLNPDGSFTYTPIGAYIGTDTFTYRAFDGKAYSNFATVTLTISGADDPPTVFDDAFSIQQGRTLKAGDSGVLNNDYDPNGGIITAFLVSGPSHGSLTLNADGTFVYTPVTTFVGTDTFTYRATDGQLNSRIATASIDVYFVNYRPSFTAASPAIANEESGPQTFTNWATFNPGSGPGDAGQTATYLLSNLSNPTLFSVAPAVSPSGTLTFTPAPNAFGTAVFQLAVRDSGGTANYGIDTSTYQYCQININQVAHAPALTLAPASGTEGGHLPLKISAATSNSTGSESLAISLIGIPSGTFLSAGSYKGNGLWALTPAQLNGLYCIPPDNSTFRLMVTATATAATTGNTASRSVTQTFTVSNVAPTASISGSSTGVRGQARSFNLTGTDPSSADLVAGLTFSVNWGDGSPTQVVLPSQSKSLTHTFLAAGNYSVKVSATDKDGATGPAAINNVAITSWAIQPDPYTSGASDLVIGGTTAADTITLSRLTNSNSLKASIDGVVPPTFTTPNGAPFARVIVYGQAGNDYIHVDASVTSPAWLYGGDGNDDLAGGGGNNVIIAGAGDDIINRRSGVDLIIAGDGADRVYGQSTNNLIIAG